MEKVKKSFEFVLIIMTIIGGVLGFTYSIQAYPQIFKTIISIKKNKDINPREAVVLRFSEPVLSSSYEENVSIMPKEEVVFQWRDGNKELAIIPKKFWKPENAYQINLDSGKSIMLTKIDEAVINFSTVDYPKVSSVSPIDGAQDVILDIEDPIQVDFDRSGKDFSFKFLLNQENELTFMNNSEKTQFKLLPKISLKSGEKYKLKIFARYKDDPADSFREIFTSSFETLPPPPEAWEKNFALRVEQAKRWTRARIVSGKYIDINLSNQIMSIFEDGRLIDSYLISSGKRGMGTPKGTFKIENKAPRAWSKTYGLYMPNWMAIVPGGKYGIHELPEWPGGYKEGQNHLGTPVSHGCVRLGVGPAKTVFDWAPIGTPVVIY